MVPVVNWEKVRVEKVKVVWIRSGGSAALNGEPAQTVFTITQASAHNSD